MFDGHIPAEKRQENSHLEKYPRSRGLPNHKISRLADLASAVHGQQA
jgi:hypothetical protein